MLQILGKHIKQRTHKENEKIVPFIKSIQFFSERDIPEKNYIDIAQSLSLLEMEKDDIVFEFDSVGDLFYIIISGTVSVFIPDKGKVL